MKRNLKLVIVLVILVVAAVAALVAVNMVSKSKDEKAAKEAAELVLISQSSDDIKSIDITDSDGEDYQFSLSGSDWILTNRDDVNLSSSFCSSLCLYYGNLNATKKITDKSDDLSTYGLDKPVKLTVSDSENSSTIYIGKATSTNEAFYVMKEGSDAVFTMDYSTAYVLSNPSMSMKNTYLTYEWSDDDYTYYKVTKQGKTIIELDRSSGIWGIKSPIKHEINSTSTLTILTNIARYELDGYGDKITEDQYSEYGFDNPYYTVEIKNNEGKDITILIGKSIDSYTDKEVPILYKDDNQVAYISYDNIYFVERDTEEYTSLNLVSLKNEDIKGGEIKLDSNFEVQDIKFEGTYSTENNSFENVKIDGKDVDMSVSNVSSLYSDFIYSVLNMEADTVEAYAEPENTADETITLDLTDGSSIKLDFAQKDENTYYIFRDGEYTGLVARRKTLTKENGVIDYYKQIQTALNIKDN